MVIFISLTCKKKKIAIGSVNWLTFSHAIAKMNF